ncbi:putative membrane protein [Marininema mesophilum]|uniref:Putative membrane protein n=2 Tax=Marininema mesophilum TaxID=1048340 RepID=A0A1H3C628_9BACL|nr:putative membrane protein [Marininema mesophilum]
MKEKRWMVLYIIMLVVFIIVFIWSGIHPKSRATWYVESGPAVLGFVILCWTFKRFSFTPLFYILAFISGLIMLIASHYTYESAPLFNNIKGLFNLSRNYCDRFGHVFQGVVAGAFFREIFIRLDVVKKKFLPYIVIGLSLAGSATYEIMEFLVGYFQQARSMEDMLGYQGDQWDTQWDMICALSGSILFLLFFHNIHDNQIKQITRQK